MRVAPVPGSGAVARRRGGKRRAELPQVRDPFFNMLKRSLNTFMNAWTGRRSREPARAAAAADANATSSDDACAGSAQRTCVENGYDVWSGAAGGVGGGGGVRRARRTPKTFRI